MHHANLLDGIYAGAARIFADVEEEYCEIDQVLQKFLEWKTGDLHAYRESYVSMCIPKLLSPLMRLQLFYWDPLRVIILKISLCVHARG